MIKTKEEYEYQGLARELWQISQASFEYGSPWSQQQFYSDLENEASLYFIWDEKGIVKGYLVFHQVLDEAEVINVAVSPSLKGKGTASQLMSQGLLALGKQGIITVFLEVRATNYPAMALYRKHKFEEIGRRKNYYHHPQEDGLVMSWSASE